MHYFGTLVNDNMEVRTLVSIDPETGAAKDTALFTYEAIPRGALLWFEVIYTNPATYSIREE
jgi:CRISPR-associated protein Cmr4